MQTVTLNNGVEMPILGFGVFQTVGQVVLRWLTQRGVVVIPKSVRPERMRENLDVFDFVLTDDELQRIADLEIGGSQFFDHSDPEVVRRLSGRRH